jgi:hypothetical protein
MKKLLLLSFTFLPSLLVFAQPPAVNDSLGYPPDFFIPAFNPQAGNEYRSANGTPGPAYWQNSSSYVIHATLLEPDTSIVGDVTITYTNHSPDALDYVWLQLDQNLYAPSSRGGATTTYPDDFNGALGEKNGGIHIGAITITQGRASYTVQPIITDTRMQLRLQTPIRPLGDSIAIHIDYRFFIPHNASTRMGRMNSQNGMIYQIAQWYPRMCVYDDIEGWNTLPYLGLGEFYCDYGNYDYYITAPADMIVYGSGDLQNSSDVLTPEIIHRLEVAAKSDQTVTIIAADEVGKPSMRPTTNGNLTWHFRMDNTRDVAFAASRALIWDAAKVNLPSGRTAMAMSCYPVESMGDSAWGRSTEYLKASIEIYSRHFFEYPWNNAVSNAGIAGGMEYPGMIFDDYKEKKGSLWFLVAHEIGHNWFPMIVGSNERRYMWQDEGLNTYINYVANGLFHNGEYLYDPSYREKDFFASLDYEQFMRYQDPLMILSDAMTADQFHQYYGKTAYGLNLLREVVIGEERFSYAFRKYIDTWAFKHPTPYDFFHCINNATGEDLNWFWKEWFFTTWKLDQTVTGVTYVDRDPAKGALITVGNQGKMIMPVLMKIIQTNGKTENIQLPVEIWQRGGTWTFHYASTAPIQQITLDPEHQLPDMDRNNNVWQNH